MKQIFVSQPMNGKTSEQIQAKRKDVAMIMKNYFEENVEVLDITVEDVPKKATPLWYLGKALEIMSTADAVVFTKGWEKYRGCRIEHTCAVEYGLRIVEL